MITGNISNENALLDMINYLNYEEQSLDVKLNEKIIMLNDMIKASLSEVLGDKVKHFKVSVSPSSTGFQIIIKTNDSVGNFIYNGTSAHDIISSSKAMPLSDGNFSNSVNHPGTKSLKADIDQAISQALLAVGF